MTLTASDRRNARLRKHADYQRVYSASRKQFSASMTYFCVVRSAQSATEATCRNSDLASAARPAPAAISPCARVGLTAGRVMGKAVVRNRIKRRMREAVRMHLDKLPPHIDVVLHPRKSVLEMEFASLAREVGDIFTKIAARIARERA